MKKLMKNKGAAKDISYGVVIWHVPSFEAASTVNEALCPARRRIFTWSLRTPENLRTPAICGMAEARLRMHSLRQSLFCRVKVLTELAGNHEELLKRYGKA